MSSADLVTYAKFLGSEMKEETSDPDSLKTCNACEILLTTALNTFFRPLPLFHVDNNNTFHSCCLCLKQ